MTTVYDLVVYEEDAVWPYAIVTYKFLKKRGIEEKKEEKEKGERSIPGTMVEETVQEGTPRPRRHKRMTLRQLARLLPQASGVAC